jgi:hypothetical protein
MSFGAADCCRGRSNAAADRECARSGPSEKLGIKAVRCCFFIRDEGQRMQYNSGREATPSDDPTEQSPDERSEARMRTVVNVRAIFNGGQSKVDCQIHNITKTGAKLTLSASIGLPRTFLLEIPSRRAVYKAEIIWRRQNIVGIRLLPFEAKDPGGDEGSMTQRLEKLTAENAGLRRRVFELAARLAEQDAGRHFGSSGNAQPDARDQSAFDTR